MRPSPRLLILCALLSTTVAIRATNAARVLNLTATNHDGQTFLTWTTPPGTGWRYRVYASEQPVWWLTDFWNAQQVGEVKDSTWCDRRLSSLTGTIYGYCIDSLATPLDATQGVIALTVAQPGQRFYCVTAESCGRGEDRTFVIGQNTLLSAIDETPGAPHPIYQRTLSWGGYQAEIYSLFPSPTATPNFAAMSNRYGSAFDCAIVRGAPGGALMVRPHARGSDLLQNLAGSGTAGEWVLALDDPWMNRDGNSFWYGWHENYDIDQMYNVVPTTGVVRDYTWQRVLHTLLWARQNFQVDNTRTYAFGYSMGGIGSIFFALRRPDLFAGVMSIIGKMDFSFASDPNPANCFNTGGSLRVVCDRMWGSLSSNLPTPDGTPIYSTMDGDRLVKQHEVPGIPPIIAFNGRTDWVVGWAEKLGFYRSMAGSRQGGYFFWDPSDHASAVWSWSPMENMKYLYRYRTNRSFPALTQCSVDSRPGFGDWVSGDSIGTINGFVEWDTTIVDTPDSWDITLKLRDLQNMHGTLLAPESLVVNATPRRLQQFAIVPLGLYRWTTTRVNDGVQIGTGIEQADSAGLVTFYWIRVHKHDGGTRLHVERVIDVTGVADIARPGAIALALGHNPASGPVALHLGWPATAPARVELYDVLGRRAHTLFAGTARAGNASLTLDPHGLGAGVYFVVARQGDLAATRRLVLVH